MLISIRRRGRRIGKGRTKDLIVRLNKDEKSGIIVMLDLLLMSDGQLPDLDERCFSVLRPSQNLDMCPNTHVTNNTTTQLRSHSITFDKHLILLLIV